MKILIPIKQVPETSRVKMDPETGTMIREGVESIINPLDLYAIETGIQIAESPCPEPGRRGGGRTTVLSMGPAKAEEALREAIAMGCSDGVLLSSRAFAGSDTWATSYALSKAIARIGAYDLILCGERATDGDTGQVGPGLAERLGIPQVTFAIGLELADKKLRARRVLDDLFEVLDVRLPALVTVVKQINEPRFPGMRNVLKAKKAQITRWTAADIGADLTQTGFDGSPTTVIKVWPPERRGGGVILRGETNEVVAALAGAIKELNIAVG